MARAQRRLLQEKVEKARQDPTKTHTLVVDYGQNMSLPHMGSIQPGDTYYYTPINVYNLGIVDTASGEIPTDHLSAHVYAEYSGAKGGNNVASLIMKTLSNLGWLNDNGSSELNIVFDNCKGQNKNNTVLCLVPFLVP